MHIPSTPRIRETRTRRDCLEVAGLLVGSNIFVVILSGPLSNRSGASVSQHARQLFNARRDDAVKHLWTASLFLLRRTELIGR